MNKQSLRKTRVRARLQAKSERPRLSVFVSNRHTYAQIIDDRKGETLVSAGDSEVGDGKKVEIAKKIGQLLGERAKKKKIKKVVFDRGGYKYHGKVKALAEGARAAGLEF